MNSNSAKTKIHERVQSIGREIFELASGAGPKAWHKAWWLDRMTQVLDEDAELGTRAFQFVDCLPALRTGGDIMRHLAEYFDPNTVRVPSLLHGLVTRGRFQSLRENVVGWGTRQGAAVMAGRFITGYDAPSAISTIKRLRRAGMAFTIDVLGESTTGDARADAYAEVYHKLIDRISPVAKKWRTIPLIDHDADGPMPIANLSIKLTGLDPHFDAIDPTRSIEKVCGRLRPILRQARRAGAFINIDMESTKHREITFELFKKLLMEDEFRDWTDVGIVVQAYLRTGEDDLRELIEWGKKRESRFAIRLVKGAYWDAETAAAIRAYKQPPVWEHKWESDACFERMTQTMLKHTNLIRPAFASHNVRSIAVVMATAESLRLTPKDYEIQMLYGMGDPLKTAVVKMGRTLRVYCPYGDLMPGMGYLIRRLLENTSNDSFLKQSFSDRQSHEKLLADPAVAQPPSSPPPARHYQNTDPEEPMFDFINASNTNFAVADNRKKMLGAINYVRGEMGCEYSLLINNESVIAEPFTQSLNASNSTEVVGRVARAFSSEVECAVAAARKAFPNWSQTLAAQRADFLRKVADRLESRRFELAATMILEVGKPWRESDADVTEAIDHFRYYAGQIERIESRPRLRNLPGEDNMLTYSPKGVCAVISPWAFPLAILSGMTAAALAAGNTVVIKPAGQAAVLAAKFVQILKAIGLPSGVVNFTPGEGASVGRQLVEHGDVNIVAFTGSRQVGAEVIRAGSVVRPEQPFIKQMIVEMGGKNAIIVDDDADLDGAVEAIVESAFSFAGQKCSSCSRLIVLEGAYGPLMDRLRDAVASIIIGPAENPSTMVGPVIDAEARDRILNCIKQADTGRTESYQAELPTTCRDGFFVPPTIITDVKPDAGIAQEEIFGPVLAVIRARDFDHALDIANGTRYALTGGLFSRSPANIERARREFAVGNLYINRKITGSQVDAQPFGGFRLSGTGVKAGSPDYLLHFMDARCITENTLRSGLVPSEKCTEVI